MSKFIFVTNHRSWCSFLCIIKCIRMVFLNSCFALYVILNKSLKTRLRFENRTIIVDFNLLWPRWRIVSFALLQHRLINILSTCLKSSNVSSKVRVEKYKLKTKVQWEYYYMYIQKVGWISIVAKPVKNNLNNPVLWFKKFNMGSINLICI